MSAAYISTAPEVGTGTVTSVNASGGTTGMTFTGGPVTTTGTFTLSGTLIVANGGTGGTTFTAYGTIIAGTTATGAFQVAAPGTAGHVLTSNGAAAAPTYQAPSAGATAVTAAATFTLDNSLLRADGAASRGAQASSVLLDDNDRFTFPATGAASAAAALYSGAIFTGGTGTTNFPHIFLQPTGTTAQTNWSTAGTGIGMNFANAYTGDFINCQTVGNVNLFRANAAGEITSTYITASAAVAGISVANVTIGSAGLVGWGSRALLKSPANGDVTVSNNAATAGFCMRATTADTLTVRNLANSAAGDVVCGNITTSASLTVGTSIGLGAAQDITWSGRSKLRSPADSKVKIANNGGTTGVTLDVSTDGKMTVRNFADGADGILQAASIISTATITLKGYTVATLPAGTVGMTAYVTDATAPTYNGALTGGGAVVVPVFYNGAAWVSA